MTSNTEIERLIAIVERELDVHEAVLTDPLTLRRIHAGRIVRRLLIGLKDMPEELIARLSFPVGPASERDSAHRAVARKLSDLIDHILEGGDQ